MLEWEMPEEHASPRINLMKVQARHQIALIRKESPWTHEEIEARRLLDDIERETL